MNVVITHLLTSTPDPLRGERWAPDTPIDQLHRSLVDCRLVVLHDRYPTPPVLLTDDRVPVEFVKVDPGVNPYWYRWHVTANWLETHADEVDRVWCVDATDVVMLNPPWEHMQHGRLYVGSEDKLIGEPYDGDTQTWLRDHCPSCVEWFARNAGHRVLNVGLVGGDQSQVFPLANVLRGCAVAGDRAEMGWFNRLVHTGWNYETGAPVHSPFLTNTRSGPYWWAHK